MLRVIKTERRHWTNESMRSKNKIEQYYRGKGKLRKIKNCMDDLYKLFIYYSYVCTDVFVCFFQHLTSILKIVQKLFQ